MRVALTVAYDGRAFHGFAQNENVRTVAGDLVGAITHLLHADEPVALACAGRTDAGVHAIGQVVSFEAPSDTDLDAFSRRLNRFVGPLIAVREARQVDDTFDARFSAVARTYRYVIWNRPEPDPFHVGFAWHVAKPLALDLLRLGCDPFLGEHDFSAFCRKATRADGTLAPLTRRVHAAQWIDRGDGEMWFTICASSFCHQMVRSVVGTLVEVGLGSRRPGDIADVIRSRDRARAGKLAPPDGLYLEHVAY